MFSQCREALSNTVTKVLPFLRVPIYSGIVKTEQNTEHTVLTLLFTGRYFHEKVAFRENKIANIQKIAFREILILWKKEPVR